MTDDPQQQELLTMLVDRAARRFTQGATQAIVVQELEALGLAANMADLLAKKASVTTVCDSHTITRRDVLPAGHTLIELLQEDPINPSDMADKGFHPYGTKWWTNPECPFAYKYLCLDTLYAPSYFASEGTGHPTHDKAQELYQYMQRIYAGLFGKRFDNIIELGTGGGEITRHFFEDKVDVLAVEGTTGGVEKLLQLGIAPHNVLKRNLKFMENLNRKFELCMCTEVAEHIEPWFASKVVQNCVDHADVVWFSAARGDYRPHYHHINEVPIQAWDNIFAHFGFNYYIALNGTMGRADRVYFNAASAARIQRTS